MLLTSYTKIVIVLALLRNALGVQQSPPNQVLNGIALLMTTYVMFPTGMQMYEAATANSTEPAPITLFSNTSAGYLINMTQKAKEPLREFLIRNCAPKHISSFCQLAQRSFPEGTREKIEPTRFIVVMPAFITSQLKGAFEIGVLIYPSLLCHRPCYFEHLACDGHDDAFPTYHFSANQTTPHRDDRWMDADCSGPCYDLFDRRIQCIVREIHQLSLPGPLACIDSFRSPYPNQYCHWPFCRDFPSGHSSSRTNVFLHCQARRYHFYPSCHGWLAYSSDNAICREYLSQFS